MKMYSYHSFFFLSLFRQEEAKEKYILYLDKCTNTRDTLDMQAKWTTKRSRKTTIQIYCAQRDTSYAAKGNTKRSRKTILRINCIQRERDYVMNLLESYIVKLGTRVRVLDGGLRIACLYYKDGKKMIEVGHLKLITQNEIQPSSVCRQQIHSGLLPMQLYCLLWLAKKNEILFTFCFDPGLSTKGPERVLFNINTVGLPYHLKNILLSKRQHKSKQVCLLFEEVDIDKNIISCIHHELLRTCASCNVIDIYHSFDPGKTEIANIDECVSTSGCFIFIPTRDAASDKLKFMLNLVASECSGRDNILTIIDSKQNTCKIPELFRPFPILICNFDPQGYHFISTVSNENIPQISTKSRTLLVAHRPNVKLSDKSLTNGVSCKFKTSKPIRIISDDIEKADLIKKSTLLEIPTAEITVNDDDVSGGNLLYFEYAKKLYKDQLFVITPSRERSREYEYALRVIASRSNMKFDTLLIQCRETTIAIECSSPLKMLN